jgi:hypothetical protein
MSWRSSASGRVVAGSCGIGYVPPLELGREGGEVPRDGGTTTSCWSNPLLLERRVGPGEEEGERGWTGTGHSEPPSLGLGEAAGECEADAVPSCAFLMLVATGLMLGLFFLTSLYVQHVLGLGALQTGLLFLPVALAVTAGAQAGAHLIARVGGRVVAAVGFGFTAAGAALLIQVSPGSGVLTGVLPGFVASGVVNTFHELGGTVGVAVVSTIAAAGIAAASGGDAAALVGFTNGYLACAVAAAVAAVIAVVLVPPGRPEGVVGHGHGHGH